MKKFLYPVLVFFLVFITGTLYTSYNNANKQSQTDIVSNGINNEVNMTNDKSTTVEQMEKVESVPSYKIVYTLTDKRYDGGENYYVLIDPVDLNNNDLKESMKRIVIDMVNDYGKKISIEIHDDINSLNLSFKLYGDLSLDRQTTDQENKLMSIHHITSFQGELETGLYKNTLSFFPNSGLGTEADNYAENIEFNV